MLPYLLFLFLTNVIFVCNDYTSWVTLFLKENQLTHFKVTDFNSEFC